MKSAESMTEFCFGSALTVAGLGIDGTTDRAGRQHSATSMSSDQMSTPKEVATDVC